MSEHTDQCALFQWCERRKKQFPELKLLFAIPNAGGYTGGYANNARRVRAMLAEGVKPGVPDLCLPVSRGGYNGLFIELKTETGRPTSAQLGWIVALQEQGFCAAISYGWESAAVFIESYLAGRIKR